MNSSEQLLSILDPRVARDDGWELSTKRLSGFLPMLRPAEASARLMLPFEGAAISLLRASIWQSFTPTRGQDYFHPHIADNLRPGPSVQGELLHLRIDDAPAQTIDLGTAPIEIPLAENLPPGPHRLELTVAAPGRTCLQGFRILNQPFGSIQAPVHAEKSQYLNDIRTTLRRDGQPFDQRLARNPFTQHMSLWGLPPGRYDLRLEAVGWRPLDIAAIDLRAGATVSLPAVTLAAEPQQRRPFPATTRRPGHFRAVQIGHLDTWCQRNAEYLAAIATLTNLLNPDVLLIGNEVNWQYVTGALNALQAPFLITSGNHGIPGFHDYFGGDLETARIGPVFLASWTGHWQQDPALLIAAFATPAAREAGYRILQGVEGDLPAALAHQLGIDLYCCGHGFTAEKPADADWVHLGKEFHLIDIDLTTRQTAITCVTDTGKRTLDKYPIARETPHPHLPVRFETARRAIAVNPLCRAVADCQIAFRLPAGNYRPSVGVISRQTPLPSTSEIQLEVHLDLPPRTPVTVDILDA